MKIDDLVLIKKNNNIGKIKSIHGDYIEVKLINNPTKINDIYLERELEIKNYFSAFL
jgi:hypothetical protein